MVVLALMNAATVYTCVAMEDDPLGMIENASVLMEDGKVLEIGVGIHAPPGAEVIDVSGKIIVPGLVDCHTHTVYAGCRSNEFLRRLNGENYSDILEEGGGILSTVKSTREATLDELTQTARARVKAMRDHYGVTTIEIKSGYGLTPDDECKMLQAAARCNDTLRVLTTFLGAHTFPLEYRGEKRKEYVKQIIEEQLPRCAKYADYIDIFCDRGAFNLEEAREILSAGKSYGLMVRAHAEQIESTGCAQLVARLGEFGRIHVGVSKLITGGKSADHLEQLTEEGAMSMGEQNVVAVLLPCAQLYLKDISPPVALLRKHNVTMAVATDFNPGSSPVHSLWTAATLACILQGLTVNEAFLGITRNAGLALGREDIGCLSSKSVADCVILSPPPGGLARIESVIQHMGFPMVHAVIINGKIVK